MADELQGCEHCGKEFSIETMVMHDDCWICTGCHQEWSRLFDGCTHEWQPHVNSFGEYSQFCTKCFGIVRNEDMPLISKQLTPTP